jgi:hypothetical protein
MSSAFMSQVWCGNPDHILEVLRDTNASAALAASIFHFGEYTVADVKEYRVFGISRCGDQNPRDFLIFSR